MAVYVLATTKYLLAAFLLLHTVSAFLMLRLSEEAGKRLTAARTALLCLFLLVGTATLFAATKDGRILLLGLSQTCLLTGADLLFQLCYPRALPGLMQSVTMLTAVGLLCLLRLDPGTALRQTLFAALGMGVLLLLPRYRRHAEDLARPGLWYAITGALALALVLLLGKPINGSHLSLSLGGFTLQLSEIVKISFVLFLASLLQEDTSVRDEGKAFALAMLHVGILVLSRDLGTALIFFVVYFGLAYAVLGKGRILATGALLGAVGGIAAFILYRHVQVRVQAFVDPWSVIETMGYQITQALFALGYGGLFGAGLTEGDAWRIPFVQTDFIFAEIAEELGILAAICVVLLCLHLFLILVRKARTSGNAFFGRILFGVALTYLFQVFLTVGGEIRFIPLTGVTLPLVSYGGSSLLATCLSFALCESLAMEETDKEAAFEERFRKEQEALFEARYRAEREEKAAVQKHIRQSQSKEERTEIVAVTNWEADIEEVAVTNWEADTEEIDLSEFREVSFSEEQEEDDNG